MLSASLVSKVGVKAAAASYNVATAQKGLTSSGVSLAELRQQQQPGSPSAYLQPGSPSLYAQPGSPNAWRSHAQPSSPRAYPAPASPNAWAQPGSPRGWAPTPYMSAAAVAKAAEEEERAMDQELERRLAAQKSEEEDAYRDFIRDVGGAEASKQSSSSGAPPSTDLGNMEDDDNMTWEGIEEILKKMMSGSEGELADWAMGDGQNPYLDAASSAEASSTPVVTSESPKQKKARTTPARTTPLQPVKEEPTSFDDVWENIPDFVDMAPPGESVKEEVCEPSRAVPSGHKLVKLRPAPTYGVMPVKSDMSKSSLPVKRETPAQVEIAERRASRRRQSFLRDRTCKAICRIKYGLRHCGEQSDAPYVPDDWSKEFEPLLGNYFEFLKSRPDQFQLEPLEGSDSDIVVNVAGATTVVAPAWNSWKVKAEKDWKVKTEDCKSELPKERQVEFDKTEAEKWAEAEPLPPRVLPRPKNQITPNGTPWASLHKARETTPKSCVKEEGEWSKANSWKRYTPLSMEPLTQPLPPMRPVRVVSAPSAPSTDGDKTDILAPATKPSSPLPEEQNTEAQEEECEGSDDDDLPFVVDITGDDAADIGDNTAFGSFSLLQVKEEVSESSADVWSLLNNS